jgi:hypothetical protein
MDDSQDMARIVGLALCGVWVFCFALSAIAMP